MICKFAEFIFNNYLKKRGLGEERVENKYEIIELYYATDREEIQKK